MRLGATWAASVVLAFGCLMTSAEAYADDDVAARVAELYSKGNKLYDKEQWAEAEAAYQAAWDLRPSFDIAGNLGDVEMQLAQYRDAAEHLTYAIQEFPAGGKPEARETLAKLLEAARTQVGSVKIVTNIGGAKLSVDGRAVGQAPLEKAIFVDPGKRVFEARLEGFEDGLVTADVQKGGSQEVSFKLLPKGGAGGGGNGGGGKSVPLIVVGAGLGLVGIGAGVGLMVAGAGLKSDVLAIRGTVPEAVCNAAHPQQSQYADQCADVKSKLSRSDMFNNIGRGALVAGGVIAVGTVIYAVLPSKKPTATGFLLVPTVAPTFIGLGATGHF